MQVEKELCPWKKIQIPMLQYKGQERKCFQRAKGKDTIHCTWFLERPVDGQEKHLPFRHSDTRKGCEHGGRKKR